MKCSLLTLSTFIDGELAPQRRSEVDAHLVGCTRCSAGAATLREEKARIGQLARVHVDPASAQMMLEQVGISLDFTDRSPAMPPPPPAPPDTQRPWQDSGSSASLPWTPSRPASAPAVIDEVAASTASADAQPDLPLEGVRSTPMSWRPQAAEGGAPSREMEATSDPSPPVGPDTGWADADDGWLDAVITPESWEEGLPTAEGPTSPSTEPWTPPVAAPEPPAPETVPAPSLLLPPPTRLAAASGPAVLWARIRDAVTVRLALARGGDALEDSAQIVSGATPRRGAPLPTPAAPPLPDLATATPATETPGAPSVELNGFAGHNRPSPATIDAHLAGTEVRDTPVDRRPSLPADVVDAGDAAEPVGWNAFAASSFGDDPVDQPRAIAPRAIAPRPLGRHSRAVAREGIPRSTRLTRGLAGMAAAVRVGTSTAVARVRQAVGGIASAGPDNRLLAGIAGIGLIFVIALLIAHGSSPPVRPIAIKPATSAAAAQPHSSAPVQSAAPTTPAAPALTQVQTFGAGDTGFQVKGLRYGAVAAYTRVVFDLGAVSGTAGGTPKVQVGFSSPTTVLVTFSGTVPAGSTGTPMPGKIISSVTLVSSSADTTVYRFQLTRGATLVALYLKSPTRFVLDVH